MDLILLSLKRKNDKLFFFKLMAGKLLNKARKHICFQNKKSILELNA